VSCHFASERAKFEQEREDFKEDIRKVSDREEEVIQKEKSLAKKEVRLDQREEAVTALHDKLKAYNTVLEKQRDKQVAAEVKLQQELADRASGIARAEGSLKAREASLAKRATDLTRQEEDLAFREEMWARRNKLLDELELEAEERRKPLEEKVRALEEQVRQFQATQVAQATQMASGPQAVEVMQKTLDDLRVEQRAGAQRIAAWASEASTTLVTLGVSPIPALVQSASISNALSVLGSAADRLRRLDQILGARLEAEGSRLCRSAIEYVLTCFRSHDPAVSLGPVIAGPVADAEDVAREGVQDVVDVVARRFQRDPTGDE
jgi:chromosome segregation ATPase